MLFAMAGIGLDHRLAGRGMARFAIGQGMQDALGRSGGGDFLVHGSMGLIPLEELARAKPAKGTDHRNGC
jgi:hypothetical protein